MTKKVQLTTRTGGGALVSSRRGLLTLGAVATAAALALSGCSTGGGTSAPKSIVVAAVAPFTGADAALGPIYMAACYAATSAINDAGGINGTTADCQPVDTRGDPADAVPAVRKLFATTSNLALVIGVTSDEAASVVPIINSNKMLMFAMTGQAQFTTTHNDYFYELVPPDLAESYAMVAIAKQNNYQKVALAFGNDIGSQTFVQPAIDSIKKAGMQLVANESLDLKATTFRTEAAKIVAGHPDVILSEALGATAASFLSEVKQLNGGKMIPIIGPSSSIDATWYTAVSAAIGAADVAKYILADNLTVMASGPAHDAFTKAMLAQKGKVGNTGNFDTYLTAPGGVHLYDGINLAALAMVEAKSTTPSVYKPFMEKIANGVSGAVVVYNFADGVAALKNGSTIRYEGPGGPTQFNSFHYSAGLFQINAYDSTGKVTVVGDLSIDQLLAVTP